MQNLCNLFLIVLLATACKPSKKAKPQSAKKPVTQAEQTSQPSSNEGFEDALKDARSKSSDPNSEHDKLQSAVNEYKNSDTYKNPKNAGQKGFNAMVDSVGDLSKQDYKDLDCSNVKGNMDNIGTMENIASAQANLENNYKKPKNPRVATSPAFYVGMSLITFAGVGAISGIPSLMEEVKTPTEKTETSSDVDESPSRLKATKKKIVESFKKLHESKIRSRFIQLGIAPLLITGISMVVTRNQDDWFPYYKGLLVSYGITGIILGLVYTIKDVRAAKEGMAVANEKMMKGKGTPKNEREDSSKLSGQTMGETNENTQNTMNNEDIPKNVDENISETSTVVEEPKDQAEKEEIQKKEDSNQTAENTGGDIEIVDQSDNIEELIQVGRDNVKETTPLVGEGKTSTWREKAEHAKAGIGVMLSGVAALSISAALGLAGDDPSVKLIKATNRALAACVAKSEAQAKKK